MIGEMDHTLDARAEAKRASLFQRDGFTVRNTYLARRGHRTEATGKQQQLAPRVDQQGNLIVNLDVFKQRKTLAPFDDLVEPVIGDAAQTGDGIAFGGRASMIVIAAAIGARFIRRRSARRRRRGAGGAAAMLLSTAVRFVAMPQVFHVHDFEQELRHGRRSVARMVRMLMMEQMRIVVAVVVVVVVTATWRGRRRRRAPFG